MNNFPSSKWFKDATQNECYPSASCPLCLEEQDPLVFEENKDCPVCNQPVDGFNSIPSHLFIKNIEDIIKRCNECDIAYMLTDFNRFTYQCPECSCIEDEQYYCTSCEGSTITEVDYIIKSLLDNGHVKSAELLNRLRENL